MGIIPDEVWKPTGNENPALRILLLLSLSVGLPYFILSTTGPLLQAWFSLALPGRSPYRLYALSNAGSLLALISYPFLFEPMFGMVEQAWWWSAGFLLFVTLGCLCAWRATRTTASETKTPAIDAPASEGTPRGGRPWQWFGLAMTASVMLLATTNQVCQDVAVVPFLWVVPLSLYLLTFILCFDGERWYSRMRCGLAAAFSVVLTTVLMLQGASTPVLAQALVAFSALFLCCMVCHGELVLLKPEPARLTSFYLIVSAGGASGGLFVGLIAPLIFPMFLEMHLAIGICLVLTLLVYLREGRKIPGYIPGWMRVGSGFVVVTIVVVLHTHAGMTMHRSIDVTRNFYGVIRIEHQFPDDPKEHTINMRYGSILHGVQFQAPKKRDWPTTYYGHESGVGRLIHDLQEERPSLKIGVIGLGVGTLAAYGRERDTIRFYEINDEVIRLAEQHFSYLADSDATIEHVRGDARLSMEREQQQEYDVLVLDAFSGDAVPAHLLTREAMAVYARHVKPDGVLAVHISNLHFNLEPVATAMAESSSLTTRTLLSLGDSATAQTPSRWILAARDASLLSSSSVDEIAQPPKDDRVLWTDDVSNLFEILH